MQLEGKISVNWLVEELMASFPAQEEYFDEPPICEESPGAMLVYDGEEMTAWIGILGPEDEEDE